MRTIKNGKTKKKMSRPLIDSIYTKKDITEILFIAEKFSAHVNNIEARFIEQIQKLKIDILKIQKEISELKKST